MSSLPIPDGYVVLQQMLAGKWYDKLNHCFKLGQEDFSALRGYVQVDNWAKGALVTVLDIPVYIDEILVDNRALSRLHCTH